MSDFIRAHFFGLCKTDRRFAYLFGDIRRLQGHSVATNQLTRRRMMREMVIKYVAIAAVFVGIYSPYSISALSQIPVEMQESIISYMGFLMAAAIIGAFELSYLRTNLNDRTQRYLAHLTKFTLYSTILLLTQIGTIALLVTATEMTGVITMASLPVILSLFIFDFWDAIRALDVSDIG